MAEHAIVKDKEILLELNLRDVLAIFRMSQGLAFIQLKHLHLENLLLDAHK
jgi:hypothetical protein